MRRKNERSSPKQKEGPSLERPESDELVKDRNRRKRPKVDASIFDSALSHTRRSDASEKTEENIRAHFWPNSHVGKASGPRLYRLR